MRIEDVFADDVTMASVGAEPQLQVLKSLIGRLEPSTHKSSKSLSLV